MQRTATSLFNQLYFLGMISLVGLPLLYIGYFAYTTGFNQLAAMDVVYADQDYFKNFKFDAASFEENTPNLVFTNDEIANQRLLKDLYKRCNHILEHPGTSRGVTVVFEKSSRYADMVNVFDLGYSFKYRISFIPYNNKVYFLLPMLSVHKSGEVFEMPK